MRKAWVIAYIVAVAFTGVIALRGENTRDKVVHGPCSIDAASAECQNIFRQSIRNFDDGTADLLRRVLRESAAPESGGGGGGGAGGGGGGGAF